MLPASLDRILALPEDARVLDVGGWAAALNRADWVIDVKPYETRGVMLPQGIGPGPERFTSDSWVVHDICDRDPWPFEDDFFDYVVCTFTLEDVRDPIGVCREMSRVGKAGYIEVPTWLDELTWENPEPSGGPWVGHRHHRWLCSLEGDELVFLAKFHSLHSDWRTRVPQRWAGQLAVEEKVLAHEWHGELHASERPTIDSYPEDELERAIRERFRPSAAELRALETRERATAVAQRASARVRRRGISLLERMGRRA